MKSIKLGITAIIFFLICTGLFSDTSGVIQFLEGTVDVSRGGEFLSYYEVDYGLEIFEEDIITTGSDGFVEIELNAPAAGTVLKVEPDTTFYFSTDSGQTNMRLLTGSLALKVGKLASGETMNVQTETAVMGVRGTDFTVNIGADTELLVTCVEGKVSCASAAKETFSEPGKVSTWSQMSDFNEESVPPSTLDEYTEKWKDARIQALMINGLKSSEYYRRQLATYQPRMERAMNSLLSMESTLIRYAEKMERDEKLSRTEAARDKIGLSRAVLDVRSNLVMYEQIFFTLSQLEKYHAEGIGQGEFSDGTSSVRFYRDFDRNRRNNMTMIAKAHFYMKVYTYIDHYASANDIMGGGNSGLDSFLNNSPLN